MKRLLLFNIFILNLSVSTYAQHFEWAVTMGRAETEVLCSVKDGDGNITQLVLWEVAYHNKYKNDEEKHLIFDAYGDTIKLKNNRRNQLVVVQFDKLGKLNWEKSIVNNYNENHTLLGAFLTFDKKANLSVFLSTTVPYELDDESFEDILLKKEFIKNNKYSIEGAEEPETDYEEEDLDKFKGVIEYKLNQKGKLIDLKRILPYGLIELLKVVPTIDSGHILLAAAEDNISIGAFEIEARKGGGYILIKINNNGEVIWAKTFLFLDENCCAYSLPNPSIAQSANGTIFIGGSIEGGIIYPNGKKVNFRTKSDTSILHAPSQAFIAALEPDGRMLWQKTSGANNTIHSIIAGDKTLHISGNSRFSSKIFGKRMDTTEGKRGFIMALSTKKGKVKWFRSNTVNAFVSMLKDNKDNIYGLGEYNNQKYAKLNMKVPAYFETDTLESTLEDVVLASYTAKGKYRWMKALDSYLYYKNGSNDLFIDSCNNLFLSGTIYSGTKTADFFEDAALFKAKANTSMAYLCKIKNTKGVLIQQNNAEKTFLLKYRETPTTNVETKECEISPGPWKLAVHPRRFNNKAIVKVKITFDDSVSLKLLDIDGKKIISTIIEKVRLKKGLHSFTINANTLNLKKGPYLLVFKGSTTILTKPIAIINE